MPQSVEHSSETKRPSWKKQRKCRSCRSKYLPSLAWQSLCTPACRSKVWSRRPETAPEEPEKTAPVPKPKPKPKTAPKPKPKELPKKTKKALKRRRKRAPIPKPCENPAAPAPRGQPSMDIKPCVRKRAGGTPTQEEPPRLVSAWVNCVWCASQSVREVWSDGSSPPYYCKRLCRESAKEYTQRIEWAKKGEWDKLGGRPGTYHGTSLRTARRRRSQEDPLRSLARLFAPCRRD